MKEQQFCGFKVEKAKMPSFSGDVREYAVFRSDFKHAVKVRYRKWLGKRDAMTLLSQGSVIGPLFFLVHSLVHINDLTTDLKCYVKFFAEDTSLFTVARETNEAADHMNHDLQLITQWANDESALAVS